MRLRFLLATLLLLVTLAPGATAQRPDSHGREFWVCFMPNLGTYISIPPELRLYASCRVSTQLTITSTELKQSVVIDLPEPDEEAVININELFGNLREIDDVDPTNELSATTSASFHIEANEEITLSGVNIVSKSADAFLCLPVDVFTGHSMVLAYPNGLLDPIGTDSNNYDTPSQFAVVATADNTVLTIIPPAHCIINSHSTPYQVKLQRGQVYLGQAELDVLYDVSGTKIDANRPVAVFAGNKRTSIPTRVGNYRDHLVEQMPPLETWGQQVAVTPHTVAASQSTDTSVFRVLAAFDNTLVTVTGISNSRQYTLGSAQVLELPLLEQAMIIATHPILVGQYEHSVGDIVDSIGDPFMTIVPPVEQYDTSYIFQAISAPDFLDNRHYANIIVYDDARGSIRLDGQPLDTSQVSFKPIPSTGLTCASINVPPGSHHIRADSAFGILVYGYGPSTSYGLPGGTLCRRLVSDTDLPPGFSGVATPSTATGAAASFTATSPAQESLRLFLNETEREEVTVELISISGTPLGTSRRLGTIGAGNRTAALPLGSIPTGHYICQLRTSSGHILGREQVMVVR